MGVSRKQSARSAEQNRAPYLASEMTLLKSIFVSELFVVGEPASP